MDTTLERFSHQPEGSVLEQLTVRIGVLADMAGGNSVTIAAADGSSLVEKYGSVSAALAACRDFIVRDLDFAIRALAE